MVCGFDCKTTEIAEATSHGAFEKGLIIERCGPTDQVVKFLPALTIEQETLGQGPRHIRGVIDRNVGFSPSKLNL